MAEVFLTFPLATARRELRQVYSSLPVGSADGALRTALLAADAAQAARTTGGFVVSGTSANGFSTTFSEPGKGGVTPQGLSDMWAHLLDLLDAFKAADATATDAELYADMMANLQDTHGFTNSYTSLRY